MAQVRKTPTPKTKAANAWRNFWQTPEGKLAIGALMARFSVYGSAELSDATAIAIEKGERNVCAWIAAQIGLKDETYVEDRSEFEDLTDALMKQYGG